MRNTTLPNTPVNDLVKANLPALKVLLSVLEVKFPQPVFQPDTDYAHVMYHSGQYSVLRHFQELVAQAELEQENL